MNETGDVAEKKREMRKRMLAVRRSLSAEERKIFSDRIVERLLSHADVVKSRSIFAYASMEDEVQTETLLSALLLMGKRVAIPFITGKRKMEAALVPSMDALERGAYRILTVKEENRAILPPQEIDCVLVPGAAFGMDGERLGMGGGYYDTFLPKAPQAIKIALAFQCQIAEGIPKEPYDCDVDGIVTEQGIYTICNER